MHPHLRYGYRYTTMSEINSTHEPSKEMGDRVSRRRLMRAGLSAAPVVLALKSNSVLASTGGYCVKPSTFASLGAGAIKLPNASQAPRINKSHTCYSHGYWKNSNAGLVPADFKTTTQFLSSSVTGFTSNPGGHFTGKTIQQVLEMTGDGAAVALARHLAAAYLTARVHSGTAVLSVDDCKNIWNSAGNTWGPVAGDKTWDTDRWVKYFDFVLG